MRSIIVPTYRNEVLLEHSLHCLQDALDPTDEVIIVNDAPGSDLSKVCQGKIHPRIINNPQNIGNTASYNVGARAASQDHLVFMDSDILLQPDTLRSFSSILSRESSIGVLGSLLLYPQDLTIQHAGVAIDKWIVTHLYLGSDARILESLPLEQHQAVTAALMACPRQVFEELQGFDETYRDGLEDIDFCLRCSQAGYSIFLTNKTPAFHLESATRGPYKSIRRNYNYNIFFSRWAPVLTPSLCDFIAKRAEYELRKFSGHPVRVINFCAAPNWRDFPAALEASGHLSLQSSHDQSGFTSEEDGVDLYRALPLSFLDSPLSLLFVTDHFKQLERNMHWFSRRLAQDVIVDRHANVVLAPNSAKGEMDARD